jgi:hypothetical protein
MKQIQVSHNETKMVTWTDEHKQLNPGNFITFKGETNLWKIDHVYEPSLAKCDIKHTWHVGGL